MRREKRVTLRIAYDDHDRWVRWASERGLTLSDLVRAAVAAFVNGEVGIPFHPSCAFSRRHRPGHVCPGCGGSARPAA